MHMNSPDEDQLPGLGLSLINLIAEHVSEVQLENICTALGHPLVNMYTEIHSEAEKWYRMWQERREYGKGGSRSQTPLRRPLGSPLTDPPSVKELVRAEVKMLLQSLKETSAKSGRHSEELLLRYKPETVHYALNHQEKCYSSCINQENMEKDSSRPSSRCSVVSSAEAQIGAVRDKLTISDIRKVVSSPRSVFLEQCDTLTELTKLLKENIKKQCLGQCEEEKPEPSLAELKELRAAIQSDLKAIPSSHGACTASFPKGMNERFKLCAGQSSSVSQDLAVKSAHKAVSPSASHLKPRPPTNSNPKISMSRLHGPHRLRSTPNSSTPSLGMETDLTIAECSQSTKQDQAGCSSNAADASTNRKGKAKNTSLESSSEWSTQSTQVQVDKCENATGSSPLSETHSQEDRKKSRGMEKTKNQNQVNNSYKDQSPDNLNLTDSSTHVKKKREMKRGGTQSVQITKEIVTSLEKTHGGVPRTFKDKRTQFLNALSTSQVNKRTQLT